MNLLLIISILSMYYIVKRYNTQDWFKILEVDVAVQILHIITLFFILFIIIYHNSTLVNWFSILHVYVLIRSIIYLIRNIRDEYFPKEDNDKYNYNLQDEVDNENNEER